jgi:transposase
MADTRRKFDETLGRARCGWSGRLVSRLCRWPGIGDPAVTLGNWVNADMRRGGDGTGVLDEDERAELARLRRERLVMAASGVRADGNRRRLGHDFLRRG